MSIKEEDKEFLRRYFADRFVHPVNMLLFSQAASALPIPVEHACHWCREAESMATELVDLSDRLNLEIYDFITDAELASSLGIDKIPALIVRGEKDYGIRFFGVPAGYEFTTLIEDLVDVSNGTAELSNKSIERFAALSTDVHLQVFVSPTCPYCPRAVRLAHQMAIMSDRITADMIEIQEFPHLAQQYMVKGVPKTVINGTQSVEGAVPESLLLLHILNATGDITEEEQSQFALYGP